MKYKRTWDAIEAALDKSKEWTQEDAVAAIYCEKKRTIAETIRRNVTYMRQYPTDREIMGFNIAVCAGAEMQVTQGAPVWNNVLDIWNHETAEIATRAMA